jgi:hypothetical protein
MPIDPEHKAGVLANSAVIIQICAENLTTLEKLKNLNKSQPDPITLTSARSLAAIGIALGSLLQIYAVLAEEQSILIPRGVTVGMNPPKNN